MTKRPAVIQSIVIACVAICMLAFASISSATDQRAPGTNSRQARKQAVKSIPYAQLTKETQAKISSVVDNPSIYRRLPITSIDVDPDMFLFLVRYPEVVVNIWQIMGVTQMTVDRTGPFNLKSDDGVGAVSDVELIYGTSTKNIYFANGTYSGPLLKRKLNGRCVMILQTNYERGPDGKPKSTNSLDVFVKVENATASLIAKTLNPLVGPTADHNFVESLNFVQRLNETTEQNGVGVQRMANRLKDVDDDVRDKFVQVAGAVYERNQSATHSSTQRVTKQPIRQTGETLAVPNSKPAYSPGRGIRRTSYRDYQNGLSK